MQRQRALQLLQQLKAAALGALPKGEPLGTAACSCSYSSSTAARQGCAAVGPWLERLAARQSLVAHAGLGGRVFARAQTHGSLAFKRLQTNLAAEAGSMAAQGASSGVPGAALTSGLSDSARRQLTVWLAGCTGWVFTMVVLGGMTRLTRSGLSMTDWKFTGERPPLNQSDWIAEFAKYQASPEFKLLHANMTVEDFKFIYWMEYAHRMWGRLLGVAFVVPGAYFAAKGYINGPLARRLGLLLLMGGTQGLVGWWMVRSGLEEPKNQYEVPRVSPYRLAAHLTSAFAIYATLAWTTLSIAHPTSLVAQLSSRAATTARNPFSTTAAIWASIRGTTACAALLRSRALPVAALVGITAVSGAFVAGMDAGRAYNTFPLMNGQLVPDEYWTLPGWRNAFESTAAVQLHHRVLALSTLAAVGALWVGGRGLAPAGRIRTLLDATAAMTAVQVTLGISTLLTYVPPHLGTAHQAGALTLFTIVMALLHALRPPSASGLSLAVSRLLPPAAAVGVVAIGAAVIQQPAEPK